MEDLGADSEFIQEEAFKVVEDAINAVFGIKENDKNENPAPNVYYTKDKVNSWCGQIMDYALRNLSNKLNKPFKYCMSTIIHQNNGAGMVTCACGYQDTDTDGSISVCREIGDMTIICCVFAFKI